MLPANVYRDSCALAVTHWVHSSVSALLGMIIAGSSGFIRDKETAVAEFGLSISEQNPDVTGKSMWMVLRRMMTSEPSPPLKKFLDDGEDFVVAESLEDLVNGMNAVSGKCGGPHINHDPLHHEITLRDMQIHQARTYWADKRGRVAKPHKILDPSHGPLVAAKLDILTRKSLGGLETDLRCNVVTWGWRSFPPPLRCW